MNLKSSFSRESFLPFALFGAAVFLISLIMRAEQHPFGMWGPHEYWASLWATDYSNGFVNRGLLGATLRLLSIDDTNYLTLTVLSWAVAIALYFVVLRLLWRLIRQASFDIRMALAFGVLLSPAISGILIETEGDPLQVVVLGQLLLAGWLLERPSHPILVGVAYAAASAAMVLIQEASVFLILPWLAVNALLSRKTPQAMAALIGGGLAGVGVVGFVILHGFSAEAIANPILHLGEREFVYEGRLAPAFSELLSEELHRMFGRGIGGVVETAMRLSGAMLAPLIAAVLLVALRLGTSGSNAKLWRDHALAFAIAVVGLGPLLVIAHDWGRFFAYLLMLFTWTMTGWRLPEEAPRFPRSLMLPIAGLAMIAGLANTNLLNEYRVNGLFANAHIFLAAAIITLVFAALVLLQGVSARNGRADSGMS